jgi:hypothetical protein
VRALAWAAFGIVAAGCASVPALPVEDPWASRWVVPEEVFAPRMASFTCGDDPTRPKVILDRWLDLLGERVVRERKEGEARLRCGTGEADRREFDLLVLSRPVEGGIDVQVTTAPAPLLEGDRCRQALASLAFVMSENGVVVELGPVSGCVPPDERPPGSLGHQAAIDAAFREIGRVELRESAEQEANVAWYGPAGGTPDWRVDWCRINYGSGWSVELFHDGVPFDAKGERDLLARYLRLLGVVPWGM